MSTATTNISTAMFVGSELHGFLADLQRFASKDSMRAPLAVRLRPGTVDGAPVIVGDATNGYAQAEAWLAVPHSSQQPLSEPAVIETSELRQVITLCKSVGKQHVFLFVRDGLLVLTDGDESVSLTPSIQSFPRTRALWPAERAGDGVGEWLVQPCHLADVAAVAKRRGQPISVQAGATRSKPTLFQVGDGFRALVMSVRGECASYREPIL